MNQSMSAVTHRLFQDAWVDEVLVHCKADIDLLMKGKSPGPNHDGAGHIRAMYDDAQVVQEVIKFGYLEKVVHSLYIFQWLLVMQARSHLLKRFPNCRMKHTE